MVKSNYSIIKQNAFDKLRKEEGPLSEDSISKTLAAIRSVIAKHGIEVYKHLLGPITGDLSDDEWVKMQKELETDFDIKMDCGILIQGSEQQDRDNTWWTGKEKQNNDGYYWNKYREYELSKKFSPAVVKTIDDDTDVIMNNIENPSINLFERYGMVVGHVQSGKTANYTGLICKAADSGYKFIVVIAGGINNLRNQTQKRLNESFIGKTGKQKVGVGRGNIDRTKLPHSLTTIDSDFDLATAKRLSSTLNFENISSPIILVIKKHTKTLSNVKQWLESQYNNKINHSMLLIDDESDYASVNTKEEEDPATINKKIRALLGLFNKSVYVAYTATPYANIFIDHKAENEEYGKDLFPKDFIYALDSPTNYFGARAVFLDEKETHLVKINDYLDDIPRKHKKDYELASLPKSLKDALRLFCLNIAIRHLRGQGDKHNSMLIHATRFTNVHKNIGLLVDTYKTKISREISNYGKLPEPQNKSNLINDFYETYNKHLTSVEFRWDEIVIKVCDTIESVVVREVHQASKIPLEYRDDFVTNAIVIGGTSLSRGYTLEGLNVSYFLRNTIFYDTLMQMGRWFGYRTGYQDLCKIYLPETIADNFSEIIEATEDLFAEFKTMAQLNKTPGEFGLAIRQHPGSALQITGRNKQKNIKEFWVNIRLDGQLKETRWLTNKEEEIKENLRLTKNFLIDINSKHIQIGNHYLWNNISNIFIRDYIDKYKLYTLASDPLGLRSKMPIAFIKKYINKNHLWDVALFSGSGEQFDEIASLSFKKPMRTVTNKGEYYEVGNRQLSNPSNEGISITNDVVRKKLGSKSDRKEIRKIREDQKGNPLLMLYILDLEDKDTGLVKPDVVAFGISFPGNALSKTETVKMKINTVYYDDLLNQELENNDNDD